MQSTKSSHFGRVPLDVIGFARLLCGIMPSYKVIPMESLSLPFGGAYFGNSPSLR